MPSATRATTVSLVLTIKLKGTPPCSVKRVGRVLKNLKTFEFEGQINQQSCIFKIDSGSDVTILNSKFIDSSNQQIPLHSKTLKYPTGENVPVQYKTVTHVNLGQYLLDMVVFVADIIDDCILGCDFLDKTGITDSINEIFQNIPDVIDNNNVNQKCCRVSESIEELPDFLKIIFENNSQHLDSLQKDQFAKLLIDFQMIFQDDDGAGKCNLVEHKIELIDPRPIKQPVRPLPFHLQSEINHMIDDMQKQGVIEESSSSWCSPVVLKRKKDNTWRFCVDFRKLNDKTIKDSYPLPRIDQTLDKLVGKSWFLTLDFKSGY